MHSTPSPRRWGIAALLFGATTINYIDRQTLSVVAPYIRDDLSITNEGYGYAVGSFLAAYTVMHLVSGRIVDAVGTRIGFALAVAWWSVAAMLHAATRGVWSSVRFPILAGRRRGGRLSGSDQVRRRMVSLLRAGLRDGPVQHGRGFWRGRGAAAGCLARPASRVARCVFLHGERRAALFVTRAEHPAAAVAWISLGGGRTGLVGHRGGVRGGAEGSTALPSSDDDEVAGVRLLCGGVSSRRMQARVAEDIAFRVLAAGNEPDFRAISDFRKIHLKALEGLFEQVLKIALKAGPLR